MMIRLLSALLNIFLLFLSLYGVDYVTAQEQEVVKMGIILENISIDESIVQDELDVLQKQFPDNVKIEYKVVQIPSANPYEVVRWACVLLRQQFAIFLSIASCPSNSALAGFARDKRVLHISINYQCDSYDEGREKSEHSFPLVVDSSKTIDRALAQILRSEKWTSFVIVHDSSKSGSRVMELLKTIKQNTKDVKHAQIEIPENVGSANESWQQFFDENVKYLFTEDAKDNFNFIVLANFDITQRFFKSAEQVIGEDFITSYNWIIVNQDLTIKQLKTLSSNAKIVALSRKDVTRRNSSSSTNRNSTNLVANQSTKAIITNNRAIEYLLDGIWISRSLVFKTSGQIDWKNVGSLECSAANTATFKDGDKLVAALKNSNIQGRSGAIQFIIDRLKVFIELEIWGTNYFRGHEEDGELWELIGSWSLHTKMQLVDGRQKPFREVTVPIQDVKLRIVTIVERPFIIRNEYENGSIYYTGCCVDMLNAIQEELRHKLGGNTFQYEMYEVADNKYGIVDPVTRKWNGLIGDILQKKADMAVAGMIRNYERELVVDFTASYMDYGVSILISKPQKHNNVFAFLEPLTVQVWISISVATFLIGLLLFVLSRVSPYSRYSTSGSNEFNFKNAMWFALASLMQQGGDATPVTTSGRIMGTFWWFFSLIIVATYTANLAAFLTVTRMETPIESLEDLANQQKIRYGTVAESSLQHFFRVQAEMDQLYERIWTYMSETQPTPMVKDEEEGLHLVLNGDYAFLWDDPVLQFHRKQNCHKLEVVGKPFNKKNYAFAVPKGAPYWQTITLSILRLQESGELDKIKQKWFESSTTCTEEDKTASSKSAEGIEIDNVAGVFYILAVGALISLITCVIEFVWFKYLSSTEHEQQPDPFDPRRSIPHHQSADPLTYDSLKHHVKSSSKDKGGHVILNKHLGVQPRHNSIIHNGDLVPRESMRDPCGREKVAKSCEFIPNKVNITPSADISPCSSGNLGQYLNSNSPESHPPYLDYLPLKTVSNAARIQERPVNV